MAEVMTPEQVAALEILPGWELRFTDGHWYIRSDKSAKDVSIAECRISDLAEAVADGLLPIAVYDWTLRAYQGQDVPTVKQWARVKELVLRSRNSLYGLSGAQVRAICDLIIPPAPPILPAIGPCPYCGGVCDCYSGEEQGQKFAGWYVRCNTPRCPYTTGALRSKLEVIEIHNRTGFKS